ncbi:hypothetical protein GCM10009841_14340 [Microlunatus panaciterrae]|uniref:Calcineurin-like phosphoesterase n=1 Tax=Microlunatus panaciterrae TaxID=400768 RepID=A0ABS2RLW6_9ACTN|nr:hypothetical protein [Microlunatus panaciterrae]MBM7799995.1 hypothetical protein [Microlunatus panaciterrae]
MKRRLGLVVTSVVSLAALAITAGSASAQQTGRQAHDHGHGGGYSFAVIGDIPYGDGEVAAFPKVVAQINADPDVQLVDHLGDIKSGSSVCSDSYFQLIKSDFDGFQDPLVYTIGDNEWTDCHRPNNGAYNPLERMAALRQEFFPRPGHTLGQHSVQVDSQADAGYPENVRYRRADVTFAAVHIVGSNNSMQPWTGNSVATPEQTAEVLGRTASVIETIHESFGSARKNHDRAVVLLTQADMFDPTVTSPSFDDSYAFQPIVAALARESATFPGPVYLFNGDSHTYNTDKPLASGSRWLSFYGLNRPVDNLTRVTIDGSDNANNYLKVTVQPHHKPVLTWTRVKFNAS